MAGVDLIKVLWILDFGGCLLESWTNKVSLSVQHVHKYSLRQLMGIKFLSNKRSIGKFVYSSHMYSSYRE